MATKMLIKQCKIELLRVIRNPYYVFWSLLMPVIFYFIFTRIIDAGGDMKEWAAHYLMSMTTFSVMGSSIMTLGIRLVQERTEGWTRFMQVTPLPGWMYSFGKMFGQTVMHLISIGFIFGACVLINGVSLPPLTWVYSALWILAGSVPFLAIGTMIGNMKRVDTASGVSNAIYLIMALLGGMWMPIETFPSVMQQIGKWLPSYNYGNGAWDIVNGQTPDLRHFLILLGYLLLFMVLSTYIRKKQEVV